MPRSKTVPVNLKLPPEVIERLEAKVAELHRLLVKQHPDEQGAVLSMSNVLRDALALGMSEQDHEQLSATLSRIVTTGMRRGRPYVQAA
jgi:Arc/MetJ-type ribon-helix-helix transcriptional regulator